MIIRAIIEWDEETKTYTTTYPELNFVSSFGDSKENTIAKLKDVINLMFEPITDDLIESNTFKDKKLVKI